MAFDQLIADCLALACEVQPSHRSMGDDDGPRMTPAEAAQWNRRITPGLQHLVDELHRTEPAPERVYELRVLSSVSSFGSSQHVLVCSDRRVVYGESGHDTGVRFLMGWPHGVLDVQNKLVKIRPELHPGPQPVLIWPRIGGDDDELDVAVRHVLPHPSPVLYRLVQRAQLEQPAIRLVAPHSGAAGVPAGWHPDPSGRHQLRWWDGSRWTEHASTNGAAVVDPLG